MRQGIKILSCFTRREFSVSRPLPAMSSLGTEAQRIPLKKINYVYYKGNAFCTARSKRKGNTLTRRCFTSLLKPSLGEETTMSAATPEGEEIFSFENDHSSATYRDDTTDSDQHANDRIWMDPETSLALRVNRFIDQPLGSIHPMDVKLTSLDLIKACGKLKSFEGMKNAQGILDRLIEEKKYANNSQGNTTPVVIPERLFKMVMYGWANMCQTVIFAPQRMREVLDLMIYEAEYDEKKKNNVLSSRLEKQNDNGDEDRRKDTTHHDVYEGLSCEPTVDVYNTLLQGLSQAATRSIQAAIEAEHALSKMDKMNKTRGWHTKPNTRSYSLVLNAYAKSGHITAGDRAESVLRDMIRRHEIEKFEYLKEYGVDFSTANPYSNNRNIVRPDTVAYTTVMKAHGHSDTSDSAEKALSILRELINSDNPALEPDSVSFATTINAFSRTAAQHKSPHRRMEAAERAEEILWMMVNEIRQSQHSDHLTGSIVPFNACLNAWAQSFTPESPHRAEELLHRMLDPDLQSIIKAEPDTVSFNTCMLAWSKACKFDEFVAPEKAEELLTLLVNLSNETTDSPKKATNWKLCPDIRSYVTVMDAYALSQREDSVIQTRRLLSDLIQNGRGRYFATSDKDKFSAHPFTIVLKAAANTKRRNYSPGEAEGDKCVSFDKEDEVIMVNDPFSIALETYSELLHDTYDLGVSADHFAFSEMLLVIAKYTAVESIERRQRVEEIFQDACHAGQVSALVVRAMRRACPNDFVLANLLRLRGNNTIASIETVNNFPRHWTSRVPQDFRRVSSRKDHFRSQSKYFRAKKSKIKNSDSKERLSAARRTGQSQTKRRKN